MISTSGTARLSYPAVALLALLAAPAAADDLETDSSDWDIMLGAGAMLAPRYEGSDRFTVMPLPVIDIVWRDRVFLNSFNGLGIYALNRDDLQLGISINYDFGRSESDDRRHLGGLGDVDAAAQGKIFASYGWNGIELSAEVAHSFGGSDGTLVEAGIAYPIALGERLSVTPGFSVSWANEDYMEAYFGVSASQSANSGLSPFAADAGFKDIDLTLDARYLLTEHWALGLRVGAGYLLGDAADSPVTQERVQPYSIMSVVYRF
jgi:outer membrane scaffolding protein for murein synthesis (MipA/OmpV family)